VETEAADYGSSDVIVELARSGIPSFRGLDYGVFFLISLSNTMPGGDRMSERSKIVVIDDEADFCEFVKWSLENTGRYEVLVSTDGPSGIALAQTEAPELILLDIRMPQMNGAEVADHLLHSDDTRDISIAFITGLLQKEEVSKRTGYIHGFPFITKPITKDELVQQVDSVFEIIRTEKRFIESLEG
jgi:CheY-like chemotaxis protein